MMEPIAENERQYFYEFHGEEHRNVQVPDGWYGNAAVSPFDFIDAERRRAFQEASASGPPPSLLRQPHRVLADSLASARSALHDALKDHDFTYRNVINQFFPPIRWFRAYNTRRFFRDLVAALAISAMAVPQSLSYAAVAQLPRVCGLFSVTAASVMYSGFGTQTIALGPVLIVSQLIADTLDPLMPSGWTNPSLWYFSPTSANGTAPLAASWAFQKPFEGRIQGGEGSNCTALIHSIKTDQISTLLSPDNDDCRIYVYAALQARYNQYAFTMTLLVGVMQFILGTIGLDFITNFLSPSILSGFINGDALIIALSQIGPLLGFATGKRGTLQDIARGIVQGLPHSRPELACISIVFVGILLLCKFLGKRYYRLRLLRYIGPLLVLLLSLATYQWREARGPSPSFGFDDVVLKPHVPAHEALSVWREILPGAIATALVSLVGTVQAEKVRHRGESADVEGAGARANAPTNGGRPPGEGKGLGTQGLPSEASSSVSDPSSFHVVSSFGSTGGGMTDPGPPSARLRVDTAQEYRALGVANVVASFFNGFVVARSQARTEVGLQAGANSPLAALLTGGIVGGVIFALVPVYGRLQKNAVAAIVFSSAAGLMDLTYARRVWRLSKKDFFTWLLCYSVSIFAGLRFGLLTAVGTAVLWVIYEIAFPHTAVLGRIPGTTVYRNIAQYPNAREVDQVLIVRLDAPLFFANIQYIHDRIAEYVDIAMERAARKSMRVEFLLLELSPVTRVDSTALASLRQIWEELDAIDVALVLVNPSIDVMRSLYQSGVADLVGREFVFLRTHDAVRYCLAKLDYLSVVQNLEEATSFGIG